MNNSTMHHTSTPRPTSTDMLVLLVDVAYTLFTINKEVMYIMFHALKYGYYGDIVNETAKCFVQILQATLPV